MRKITRYLYSIVPFFPFDIGMVHKSSDTTDVVNQAAYLCTQMGKESIFETGCKLK